MGTITSGQITLEPIASSDGYTVDLSSVSHVFMGDVTGAVAGLTCETQVTAFCGQETCQQITVGTVTCPNGISATITNNGTSSPTITFTTTATVTSSCEATIPVTVDTITIIKKFSFAVSKAGAKGDPGSAGKSIGRVTNYYLATNTSSGVTTSTSGWTDTIQSVSSTQKYLWNYEVIQYSDGTLASTSEPCIIGTYGDTGNGISFITEYYQVSNSNSTAPTSWLTTIPTMTTTNKYLWNYEVIAYTDGTTKPTSKRVVGVYGDTGAPGVSVESTTRYYLLSDSTPSKPTASSGIIPSPWSSTEPAYEANTTKSLYYVDCTQFSDGTSLISNVSKSASYDGLNSKPDMSDVANYVSSRGENLVTNGTCLLGDNTNLSSFAYDGSDTYYAGGCFKYTSKGDVSTDEYIPVDVSQKYELSYYIKPEESSMRYYDVVYMYDVDKKSINADHVMFINGSTTTLAQDLKNGDTVVYLTNVSGFNKTTTNSYQRGLTFWNYTNSKGYTYEPETYSRNYYQNLWSDGSTAINTTNNTITLASAWSKGTIPAGTSVSQCSSGNTYIYLNANYICTADIWTHKTGTVSGVGRNNAGYKFREGTAFVRIGWRMNYNGTTSDGKVTKLSTITFTQNANKKDTVSSVDVEYYLSTSTTTPSGGSWSTTAPTWASGKYMWSRTVTVDGLGNKTYSPSQNGVCIAGAAGSDGKGVSSIVEEYYQSTSATSLTGGSWSKTYPSWVDGKYIWTRSTITYTDNSTTTTTAICVSGATGATGPQGAQGAKGDKGDTGSAGRGVKSTVTTYQAGSSGTAVPTGTWTESKPKTSASLPYFWTRTVMTYTDNTTSTSYSVGATPEGIVIGGRNLIVGSSAWTEENPATTTAVADAYSYLTSSVYLEKGKVYTLQAVSDSVWSTVHGGPTGTATIWIALRAQSIHRCFTGDGVTSGRYVWTFTHTSDTGTYEIRVNGYSKVTSFWDIKIESGNKATDWTPAPEDSMASVDVEYYLSTSTTTPSGGSWSTTAPAWVEGKYMWSRTVKSDGAGNKTYSPSQNGVCIAGAQGSTGVGIKSVVEQYYQSTSTTSQTGGSWSTTAPTWANGKYIWTRSVTTYTDGTTSTTTPICVSGSKGDTGAQGYGLVAYVSRPSFTEANWTTYGTIGHEENWSNTLDIRNGCRVGDLFAISGTATDTKNVHTLIYRSTTASGTLYGVCIQHTIDPCGVSVSSTTRYYITSASKPSVPTTNPPGDSWTTTEPEVIEDSSASVYFTDCTVYSDTSFKYSPVSICSAYPYTRTLIDQAKGQVVIEAEKIWRRHVTNQIPISTDTNGTVYNDIGYKENVGIDDGTVNALTKYTGYQTTGFIPCTVGQTIYLDGITFTKDTGDNGKLVCYDSSKNFLGYFQGFNTYTLINTFGSTMVDGNYTVIPVKSITLSSGFTTVGCAYIRIVARGITDESIITIDQSIEEVKDGGTLSTVIDGTGLWESKYTDANGDVVSSLEFDFANKLFGFNGKIQANSGKIGGFEISDTHLRTKSKDAYNDSTEGVYIGSNGIGLGAGKFYVNSTGYLYSTSGKIGGFTIGANYLTNNKITYNDSNIGVFIGPGGIGLGNGKFYVDNAGYMYSTSGKIGSFFITDDYLYSGSRTSVWSSNDGFYLGPTGFSIQYTDENGTYSVGSRYDKFMITTNNSGITIEPDTIFYTGTSSGTAIVAFDPSGVTASVSRITSISFIQSSGIIGGYSLYIDNDEIKWSYDGTSVGKIVSFSTYVNIIGTFKTNGSAWISSSDARLKNTISEFSDSYDTLFDNLIPRTYKWNEGTSGRIHSGFIVQEVVDAIETAGLTTKDFAAVVNFLDEDGNDDGWGLRYEELISLNTWQIQKLKARVAELEEKIHNLEAKE